MMALTDPGIRGMSAKNYNRDIGRLQAGVTIFMASDIALRPVSEWAL
jgi:hypothetical protein